MLGNAVFLLYSSLILFDLLLTCCVLAAFLSLHAYARTGRRRDAVVFGLLVGLGILAKGPVVLVHLVWPVLLYPFWKPAPQTLTNGAFYRGVGLGLLAAFIPVAVWLGPALLQTDGEFARALLWDQSAGRISGQMEASHPRPFYFYLALLPVMLLPWIASPTIWRAVRARAIRFENERGPRAPLPSRLGRRGACDLQPDLRQAAALPRPDPAAGHHRDHRSSGDATLRTIRRTALALAAGLVLFQAVASFTLFPRYDLEPIAAFVRDHPDARFGFVGGYQGEINFLARRTQPIELVALEHADAWFSAYPGGYLIDFYKAADPTPGQPVVTMTIEAGSPASSSNPQTLRRGHLCIDRPRPPSAGHGRPTYTKPYRPRHGTESLRRYEGTPRSPRIRRVMPRTLPLPLFPHPRPVAAAMPRLPARVRIRDARRPA